MNKRILQLLLAGCTVALVGCASEPGHTVPGTGGVPGSGGDGFTGGSGGRSGSGGVRDGSGGTGSGGMTVGSGGKGWGGAIGSGGKGSGGTTGSGGGSGSGGNGGGGGAPVPSAGCGRTPTLKNSPGTTINYNTITSSGVSRRYILRLPDGYDNTHPYRLVLAYHWYTGSASQVFDCNTESIKCYTTQSPFYGLWNLSKNSTIFVAPDGLNAGWANTNGQDVVFTDDILKQVEADLCIDTSRVFANGFSYGGGMTKALACARPKVFRAVAVYAGADFLSGCSGGTEPVAFYGAHGLSDPTNAYESGKQIRDRFVKNNGCTAQNPPEPAVGSGSHVCTSYVGCSSGHPTRWCAFDGVHDPSPKDKGSTTSWNPAEVWAFFSQF